MFFTSDIKMIEDMLMPCPFCGGKARAYPNDGSEFCQSIFIECDDCKVSTRVMHWKHAVDQWNRRVIGRDSDLGKMITGVME